MLNKVDVHIVRDKLTGVRHQAYSYLNVTSKYVDTVEWLALFDTDELLYDSQQRSINTMLDTIPKTVGQIFVPWIVFGANDRVLSVTYPETRLSAFTTQSVDARYRLTV